MSVAVLILLAFLLLGAIVGSLAGQDPGYVLISYGQHTLETSLWFALGTLLVAGVAIWLLYVTLSNTLGSPRLLGRWFRKRSARSAEARTAQGMLLLAEDEWSEAKRLFSGAADGSPIPVVNHLAAARAAHELGQRSDRDQYLDAAEAARPDAAFAVMLSRAQMQVESSDWEPALATLMELKSRSPRHSKVQRLLAQTYEALEDWSGLAALLPGLRKTRALSGTALNQLQERVLIAELEALDSGPDQIDLREALWKKAPKPVKVSPALLEAYTRCALRQGNAEAAEAAVRAAVPKATEVLARDALILLYSTIPAERLERQLQSASQWRNDYPSSAAAALAMGRMRMREERWDKARSHFEESLKLAPSPQVYAELGRLCCALGETERGSEYLKVGLPGLPELPLPKRESATPSLAEVVAGAGDDADQSPGGDRHPSASAST